MASVAEVPRVSNFDSEWIYYGSMLVVRQLSFEFFVYPCLPQPLRLGKKVLVIGTSSVFFFFFSMA